MNAQELERLKATFPWTHRVVNTGMIGGLVQVIDKNGNEVPIFTMVAFLELITARATTKQSEEKPASQEGA